MSPQAEGIRADPERRTFNYGHGSERRHNVRRNGKRRAVIVQPPLADENDREFCDQMAKHAFHNGMEVWCPPPIKETETLGTAIDHILTDCVDDGEGFNQTSFAIFRIRKHSSDSPMTRMLSDLDDQLVPQMMFAYELGVNVYLVTDTGSLADLPPRLKREILKYNEEQRRSWDRNRNVQPQQNIIVLNRADAERVIKKRIDRLGEDNRLHSQESAA